jgi:hypothetical protein
MPILVECVGCGGAIYSRTYLPTIAQARLKRREKDAATILTTFRHALRASVPLSLPKRAASSQARDVRFGRHAFVHEILRCNRNASCGVIFLAWLDFLTWSELFRELFRPEISKRMA